MANDWIIRIDGSDIYDMILIMDNVILIMLRREAGGIEK